MPESSNLGRHAPRVLYVIAVGPLESQTKSHDDILERMAKDEVNLSRMKDDLSCLIQDNCRDIVGLRDEHAMLQESTK